MNNKALSPQELSEQWCAKHPEVISYSSDTNNNNLSAMDKAVKIISLETSTEKGKADLFRAAAPFGVSFLDSIPGQPHPATDFLGARDVLVMNKNNTSNSNTMSAAAAAVASLENKKDVPVNDSNNNNDGTAGM